MLITVEISEYCYTASTRRGNTAYNIVLDGNPSGMYTSKQRGLVSVKKEEKKQAYVLCPRCELNYIKSKDKYCTVCKAEMGLVDPSILLPDEEEAGLEKLCPVCHINYIGEDEEICFLCQKEREEREASEKKNEWDDIERDSDDINTPIGILPLEEESLLSDEETEEEEEPEHTEEDDFDYPDTLEGFDDEDFDDEDEEDDFDDEDDF